MTPERLKLADKIEAWSPEKWKPLTLTAHERRFAVAALRATPDARVKEALEALDNSQSLLAMIYHLNTKGCVEEHDWEGEGLGDLIQKQIAENRAALSHQPGTGEADGSLQGMIRAVYGECDAEDCAFVDREWAKLRGYILPTDGTSTIAKSPALDTATVEAASATETWAYIERLLHDECGLMLDCGLEGQRTNCINAIKNGLPDAELMAAAIEFLSKSDGLHKIRVNGKMMDRKSVALALTAKEGA